MNLRKRSLRQTSAPSILPRLRIVCGENIALGPGKAALLKAIQQQGSISRAAAQMSMSYMRAWTLVRTMNRSFKQPLVVAVRGAARKGGGAHLTTAGLEVLAAYERMNAKCLRAIQTEWRHLQGLVRSTL